MRGRPFGRGSANILHDARWLASGGEERRREAIRVGTLNRKSLGKPVGGRGSKLHNRDGTLTKLGQDILDARDFGLPYRRIAKRFGIGRTTAWRHYRDFRENTGQNIRDDIKTRKGPETENRDATDSAEDGGPGQLRPFRLFSKRPKGACFGVQRDSLTSPPRAVQRFRGTCPPMGWVSGLPIWSGGAAGTRRGRVQAKRFCVGFCATSCATFPFSMERFVGVSERPAFRGQVRMEGT